MNRCLLITVSLMLLAGCGSEADLPIDSKEPESTEPTDKHALYRAEIEKAHELVRQAARLMDSIVSPADARAACAELDKLSDKVIVVADEIARYYNFQAGDKILDVGCGKASTTYFERMLQIVFEISFSR